MYVLIIVTWTSNDPASVSDADLIARFKAGDHAVFDVLYRAHVGKVQAKLFAILGPDADVDDLIQITFIQVHRSIHDFRGDSAFTTWLHRITVNVALSHRRRQRRLENRQQELAATHAEPSDPAPGPDDICGSRQAFRMLYDILEHMKPHKRTAYVLFEIEGHSLEEIAEIVGASPNTVSTRLRAARQEVQRAVEKRLKRQRLESSGAVDSSGFRS